jgi:hypothetical protein
MKKTLTLLALLAATHTTQAQSHSYYFRNNLAESAGGPTLTQVFSYGAAPGNFSNSLVPTTGGQCGTGPQTVFNFNDNGGLSHPNGLITSTYTIHIFFKFNALSGYQRIIDFKNGTIDRGLYTENACLRFFNAPIVGICPYFQPNTYYLISLVRDGATDSVDVYVNGSLFVNNYYDNAHYYRTDATTTPIIFFRDDNYHGGESRDGSIKYLSITPTVSSPDDVASTFTNICAIALSSGLSHFSGQRTSSTNVLQWKAGPGGSTLGYDIQRSADGHSWQQIGTRKASDKMAYSFTDAAPPKGASHYRIRSIGADGSESFSHTVTLHAPAGAAGWALTANPASTVIEARSATGMSAAASLFNMQGQEVWKGQSADGRIAIPATGLPAGIYSLVCRQPGGQDVLRVVVQP